MSADPKELEKRMHGALDALKKEFAGLRTGRASVNLLDPVMVEGYGQRMPLQQVGGAHGWRPPGGRPGADALGARRGRTRKAARHGEGVERICVG